MKISFSFLISLLLSCYALAQVPIELPAIELEEEAERKGSAGDGYVVDNVTNFGPWGDKKLVDLPATVTIIPSEMIENRIARTSEEVFKLSPIIHTRNAFDINNITEMTARGFSTKRAYIKGVQTDSLGLGVFLEDVRMSRY
jgi:outer membrane receptor for monomeric catechols